jgi:hypothetical protein
VGDINPGSLSKPHGISGVILNLIVAKRVQKNSLEIKKRLFDLKHKFESNQKLFFILKQMNN